MTGEDFASWYERYWQRVCRYITRKIGNPTAAEDVAGGVFLRMWDRRDKLRPAGGELEAYTFTAARHASIDYLRGNGAVALEPIKEDHARAQDFVPTVVSDLEVQRLLAPLTSRQREAIRLYAIDGYQQWEVAERTGNNTESVKKLCARAKHQLRKAVLPV